MRWYWVVACSNAKENPLVADEGNLEGFDEWDFVCRGPINSWPATSAIRSGSPQNDGEPDDVLQNYLNLPIFSANLQGRLNELKIGGIQYLPIAVYDSSLRSYPGYAIANILNCRDALDEKMSKYSRYKDDWPAPERRGEISGILKPVLRKEMLEGLDIVRLSNFNLPIYVSQRFKDVFESQRFTGYDFLEVRVS